MSQKSLFFNALPNEEFETGYDRNYSADDISDWFSIVCETGVLKPGLAVSAGSGLTVNVAVGKATVKGKGYVNNAIVNLSVGSAPTGENPVYVPIKLQMNNVQSASGRFIQLVVGDALTTIPTIANLTQTSTIWELMLAYAVIQPNATSVGQVVDTRGQNVCPWFTAVKGYDDYYDAIVQQFEYNGTMSSSGTTVITNLAANLFNNKYSLVEVYCNGLKEENTEFEVSASSSYITITFDTAKAAGTEVCVILNNFIDGEGLATAISSYNEWVNDVATLKEAFQYVYACNGETDNVDISTIINTFINGGTDYGSMNLKIVGTFGYTAFVAGEGTSSNPYRLFNINSGNRRVTLDFTNCSQISVATTGKCVRAFVGANLTIKGLNLIMSDTGTNSIMQAFYNDVVCENCRIWVTGYSQSYIATGGTFTNCRGSITNASGNSYCFINKSILRINGGYYLAYTGGSSAKSAVVGQSQSNAVAILYGVNAPTIARSGYYQTNAIYQTGTGNYVNCTDLISALTLTVVTSYSNVRGTIPLSIN